MTDIAERLRAGANRVDAAMGLYPDATIMREAADEIERLLGVVSLLHAERRRLSDDLEDALRELNGREGRE